MKAHVRVETLSVRGVCPSTRAGRFFFSVDAPQKNGHHNRVKSTVPMKPQQHKSLFLTCCCNKLLDVLYGSSAALIIAPLCVWLLVAARCPWPRYAPHFLHQKDYAHPFRKQFTWGRNVSAFSLLVLRTTLILDLVLILVFGWDMTINMMIPNTLIFALGCGVRLSRARGGDIVSGTCSTTTGRHGAQPQLDEDNSLGVDSGCSCSSQGLEQQVRRTADVPRPDLRDSAPACAAASSSPPCKNNATESAVDTAANPRRSANDHEEPALLKAGEIIPPSPAKMAHAWIIDTGVTCHVTGDRELLRDLRPSVLSEQLLMASGLHLPVVGTGSIQTDRITLLNVRYAPGLLVNLISVAQLCGEHSLVMIFEPDVLYIKKTASAEIIGQASLDGSGLYVLDYLHLTGTSTGSHPHLDAEAEPCGIHSGHSSSQSTGTGTGQQAMPAYACSTKDEDQMPVALIAPSSTQAGGYPEVFIDSGASFRITGFGEALQNPEHKPMDIHASSSTQAGGDLVVVLDSGACFHMTGCGEVLQNREDMEEGSVVGISGTPLPVTGQGSIMGTPVLPIWLDKVRYVQGLPRLIVSVSQLTRARSARVVFEPDCCRVERMSDNCTIGQGKRVGDLYTLDFLTHG